MKKTICMMALMTIGLAGGCSGTKKTYGVPQSESVTDISAPAPAPAPIPAPQPVPQALSYETNSPQNATPAVASAGGYTVRRGDTLYGIARQRYGDGKQWTRIASANPGLRPETLKVGQTIVVP